MVHFFDHFIGFCFIHGCWCRPGLDNERYVSLSPENSERNNRPFQWTYNSDPNPTQSNGQGGQGPQIQREKEDKKVWENNQVCLEEGLCRDQATDQGPVCKENRHRSWSGSDVLHFTNGRNWIWHCPFILKRVTSRRRRPPSDNKLHWFLDIIEDLLRTDT